MKKPGLLIASGILLYVAFSALDRFLLPLPRWAMIPAAIAGGALLLWGLALSRKNQKR